MVQSGGLDLSLLTSVLAPVEAVRVDDRSLHSCLFSGMTTMWQVEEGDEPWEFDRLLQQVSQEIQAEADRANADDESA